MMISKVFFIKPIKENAIINILKFIIKISDPFVTFVPLCMKTDFQVEKKKKDLNIFLLSTKD